MPNFTISLEDIKEFEKEFNFELNYEWLREAFSECSEISIPKQNSVVTVRAIKDGKDIYVRGEFRVVINTVCVSCLEDISLDLQGDFNVIFTPKSSTYEPKHDIELTQKELLTEYYEGEEIILDNIFREAILLEVPMAPRCSEQCEKWKEYLKEVEEGGEIKRSIDEIKMEIDPRWTPLLKLKLK